MILVTGATGNNGLEILKRLSLKNRPVRAMVRNRTRATLPCSRRSCNSSFWAGLYFSASQSVQARLTQFSLYDRNSKCFLGCDCRCESQRRRCARYRRAVAALTESGHEGRIYDLTGSEALTHSEMAEYCSAALGRQIAFVDVPLETMREAPLLSYRVVNWKSQEKK